MFNKKHYIDFDDFTPCRKCGVLLQIIRAEKVHINEYGHSEKYCKACKPPYDLVDYYTSNVGETKYFKFVECDENGKIIKGT